MFSEETSIDEFHIQEVWRDDFELKVFKVRNAQGQQRLLMKPRSGFAICRNHFFEHSADTLLRVLQFREASIVRWSRNQEATSAAVIFEYVQARDLLDVLLEIGSLSERLCRTYAVQLVRLVESLHATNQCLLGICLRNILVFEDFSGFKLARFFLSKNQLVHERFQGKCYLAPEMLNQGTSYEKADIFAVGVVLFTMMTKKEPFFDTTPADPFYKLLCEDNKTAFWKQHSKRRCLTPFSAAFKDFFEKLIQKDPVERMTISKILEHPWLVEGSPLMSREEVMSEISEKVEASRGRQSHRREQIQKNRKLAENISMQECSDFRSGEVINARSECDFTSIYLFQLHQTRKLPLRSGPIRHQDLKVQAEPGLVMTVARWFLVNYSLEQGVSEPGSLMPENSRITLLHCLETNENEVILLFYRRSQWQHMRIH